MDASRRMGHRLFVVFENRLHLLSVEAQEEREKILQSIWLALGAALFGLLAGISLSLTVMLALWEHSPILVPLGLAAAYTIAAVLLYAKLSRLQRDWQTLSGTIEQLKKDRECLENHA